MSRGGLISFSFDFLLFCIDLDKAIQIRQTKKFIFWCRGADLISFSFDFLLFCIDLDKAIPIRQTKKLIFWRRRTAASLVVDVFLGRHEKPRPRRRTGATGGRKRSIIMSPMMVLTMAMIMIMSLMFIWFLTGSIWFVVIWTRRSKHDKLINVYCGARGEFDVCSFFSRLFPLDVHLIS